MRGHWLWLIVAIGCLLAGDAYSAGWLIVLAIPAGLMALQPRDDADDTNLPEDRWWK